MNGYWPANFPQRKLTKDEGNILEKAFLKIFFATRDIKELEEFCLTYFMMTTNMKDYILEDHEELRNVFADTVKGHFEHDLYNKLFSLQDEGKCDRIDTLHNRIKF